MNIQIMNTFSVTRMLSKIIQARNSVRCSMSSSGSRGPMVLPVFARDVFVGECRSHPGVESIRQTDFEADREVARAAAKLKCPVLR